MHVTFKGQTASDKLLVWAESNHMKDTTKQGVLDVALTKPTRPGPVYSNLWGSASEARDTCHIPQRADTQYDPTHCAH